LGRSAPRRLGDAVHGAHDGHRPSPELPDASGHGLPARGGPRGPRRIPARRARVFRVRVRARTRLRPCHLELVAGDPGLHGDGGRPVAGRRASGTGHARFRRRRGHRRRPAPHRPTHPRRPRLLRASGAATATAAGAVPAGPPLWLIPSGFADPAHAATGLFGVEVPLVVDGPERAPLPLWARIAVPLGLIALVAAGGWTRR